MDSEIASDRRNQPRHPARERALVMVTGEMDSLPHHLIDIGPGGMAFRYFGSDPLPLTGCTMDVFWNEDLRIARLPVSVASDQPLPMGNSLIPRRRCGLKFGALTLVQHRQLNAFISDCCATA